MRYTKLCTQSYQKGIRDEISEEADRSIFYIRRMLFTFKITW